MPYPMATNDLPTTEIFPESSSIQPPATAAQTRFRDIFDSHTKNAVKTRRPYTKTAVLLISWRNGDLNTGDEVLSG